MTKLDFIKAFKVDTLQHWTKVMDGSFLFTDGWNLFLEALRLMVIDLRTTRNVFDFPMCYPDQQYLRKSVYLFSFLFKSQIIFKWKFSIVCVETDDATCWQNIDFIWYINLTKLSGKRFQNNAYNKLLIGVVQE